MCFWMYVYSFDKLGRKESEQFIIWGNRASMIQNDQHQSGSLTAFSICEASQLSRPSCLLPGTKNKKTSSLLPTASTDLLSVLLLSRSSQSVLSVFISKTSDVRCPSHQPVLDPVHPGEAQYFKLCCLHLCLLSYPHSHKLPLFKL